MYVRTGLTGVVESVAREIYVHAQVPAPSQAVYVDCQLRVTYPHWSTGGRTVLFKTYVHCTGTLPLVRVEVRWFMARRTTNGTVMLVAGAHWVGSADRGAVAGADTGSCRQFVETVSLLLPSRGQRHPCVGFWHLPRSEHDEHRAGAGRYHDGACVSADTDGPRDPALAVQPR